MVAVVAVAVIWILVVGVLEALVVAVKEEITVALLTEMVKKGAQIPAAVAVALVALLTLAACLVQREAQAS